MKDPERLLHHRSTELARLLLEAGSEEKPSANARGRIALVVAAAAGGGTLATSGTAAATAQGLELATPTAASSLAGGGTASAAGVAVPGGAKLGWIMLAKWFGLGALGGVVALPLVHAVAPKRAAQERDATTTASSARSLLPSPGRGADAPRVAGATPENARLPQVLGEASAPPKVAAARSAAASIEALVPAERALLAAEVRFVEQGRAAFQRGAFHETIALLTPYEERFPRQQLLTEVLFLRMEAFSRAGDAGRARSLAALVLSREIAGAQAVRAREVLAR